MNKTSIEWTDFTVNPFRFRNLETGKVGHHCDKISPGCKNCYSSTMQAGPYLSGLTFISMNKPKGEFFLDEGALQQVLRRKKPCRIFWCDMTDMFLADYPDEWIDRCFAVMALTPQHTHQVLTKRADRMRAYFAAPLRSKMVAAAAKDTHVKVTPFALPSERVFDGGTVARGEQWIIHAWPLPNVHLGVSVENQEYADNRIPDMLLAIPAAVRFVSYEPALGPVDFRPYLVPRSTPEYAEVSRSFVPVGLDQIIIGGESGPDARPFDIQWARNAIAQCNAAGVACFVKQLGAKPYDSSRADIFFNGEFKPRHANVALDSAEVKYAEAVLDSEIVPARLRLKDRKGGDTSEWAEDLRVRQMPEARL